MASLADLERLLERVFERSTARLFRTRVQAVQLERRVERSMERARVTHGARTTVPGRYRVRLNPTDLADLAPERDDAAALAGRLADAALAFARAHAYYLPARPTVLLVSDGTLARGQVEVDAAPGQTLGSGPVPAPAPPGNVTGRGLALPAEPATAAPAMPPASPIPAMAGAASTQLEPAIEASSDGIRGDGTQTLVIRRPAPPAARAVIRVSAPDGSERTIEVDGTPLTLGRARDSGLVLADPRVSRIHGRLQARRGALVYTDLGSTNGSRVNGIRVDEIALGMGDRVQVGDTVLVVETLPG
jgi:hypothetical protein